MIYSEALTFMQRGYPMKCSTLGDPEAYVFLAQGGRIVSTGLSVREEKVIDETSPCIFLHGAPDDLRVMPAFCLVSDGAVEVGWRPSASDQLAQDWKLVRDRAGNMPV